MGESFTTTAECGGISSGTSINSDDTIQKLIKDMLVLSPNKKYESKYIGSFSSSSLSDVDYFFALNNHNNNYERISLGNYITINDGVYNKDWVIAGFDMEHNRVASDGTIYNNGYGICMIPKTSLGTMKWNSSERLTGAYMSSTMHTTNLVTVANNLKTVLGDHLVSRNVLLSNSIDSSNHSNSYTWTTSYCTLMSAGQLNGTFGQHTNQYDDGEANYKLPLFDYEGYASGDFWLRGISGGQNRYEAYRTFMTDTITPGKVNTTFSVYPLIYLR